MVGAVEMVEVYDDGWSGRDGRSLRRWLAVGIGWCDFFRFVVEREREGGREGGRERYGNI